MFEILCFLLDMTCVRNDLFNVRILNLSFLYFQAVKLFKTEDKEILLRINEEEAFIVYAIVFDFLLLLH